MLETKQLNVISKDDFCFEAEDQIKKLSQPLFKRLGIHYFEYSVAYPNGKGFTLCTNANFYKAWFEHELPLCEFSLPTNWYTFDGCSVPAMKKVANACGIDKGIIHLDRTPDQTVIVAYASDFDDKKDYSFYMNHLSLFKRFKHYFLENAAALLTKAEAQSQVIPETMRQEITFPASSLPPAVNKLEPILDPLFYPFNLLSKRESECYSAWVKGYSTHEICQLFNLAPSTVSIYKERIKRKLGCKTRAQLVAKAQELGLLELFLI